MWLGVISLLKQWGTLIFYLVIAMLPSPLSVMWSHNTNPPACLQFRTWGCGSCGPCDPHGCGLGKKTRSTCAKKKENKNCVWAPRMMLPMTWDTYEWGYCVKSCAMNFIRYQRWVDWCSERLEIQSACVNFCKVTSTSDKLGWCAKYKMVKHIDHCEKRRSCRRRYRGKAATCSVDGAYRWRD